ncbi:Pseudouridine synthase [Alphaproteobacteria bacterium]
MKCMNVAQEDDGVRLDRWFKRYFPEFSFTQIAKLVRKGSIRVEGKKVNISTRLETKEEISFPISLPKYPNKRIETYDRRQDIVHSPKYKSLAKSIKDWVIYKDGSIIAINKPAGIAVQGGVSVSLSIDDLLDALKFEYDKRPKLVHRLDKATSGVLLLGRTLPSTIAMGQAFKDKRIRKKYMAIWCGIPKNKSGTITFPLYKPSAGYDKEYMQHDEAQGREAMTSYKVIAHNDQLSLVELTLLTGRTHQIRAHSAMIGHPVLGDKKYAEYYEIQKEILTKQVSINFMHLHAYQVELTLDNKPITIVAPLPRYFQDTMRKYNLMTSECK